MSENFFSGFSAGSVGTSHSSDYWVESDEGRHIVTISELFFKSGYKGKSVILKTRVLDSDNDALIGKSRSKVYKWDKDIERGLLATAVMRIAGIDVSSIASQIDGLRALGFRADPTDKAQKMAAAMNDEPTADIVANEDGAKAYLAALIPHLLQKLVGTGPNDCRVAGVITAAVVTLRRGEGRTFANVSLAPLEHDEELTFAAISTGDNAAAVAELGDGIIEVIDATKQNLKRFGVPRPRTPRQFAASISA